MTDDAAAIKRLKRYALGVPRKLLRRYDLAHDEARHEDITQSLLLEGWKVWRDTGDEGLAKHRMSSRANNEEQRLAGELRLRPVTSLGPPRVEPSVGRVKMVPFTWGRGGVRAMK